MRRGSLNNIIEKDTLHLHVSVQLAAIRLLNLITFKKFQTLNRKRSELKETISEVKQNKNKI